MRAALMLMAMASLAFDNEGAHHPCLREGPSPMLPKPNSFKFKPVAPSRGHGQYKSAATGFGGMNPPGKSVKSKNHKKNGGRSHNRNRSR